jgi:hypothetical protein
MSKLKLQVESIQVVTFEPSVDGPGLPPESFECTTGDDCMVTGNIGSCWCSEYQSCWFTEADGCETV